MSYRSKLQSIRTLLLDEWDPIGVKDQPAAQDEYDQYLPPILALLERGALADDIEQYLGDVVGLDMGLATVAERDRVVARALLKLRLI
jgi:hypothetical protein